MRNHLDLVAPFMGAWIEISVNVSCRLTIAVAPFMGAWIEILFQRALRAQRRWVAPFMGAWIEIEYVVYILEKSIEVAPFMGAWIEISLFNLILISLSASRPSWARGLKFRYALQGLN